MNCDTQVNDIILSSESYELSSKWKVFKGNVSLKLSKLIFCWSRAVFDIIHISIGYTFGFYLCAVR